MIMGVDVIMLVASNFYDRRFGHWELYIFSPELAFSIIVKVLNEEITHIDKTDLFGTSFLVPCFGPTSSLQYR